MISSTNRKPYSVDDIRKKHSRAYEKWSEQEDTFLLQMYKQGKSIEELSPIFQRSKGAIQSRINKLESPEKIYYSGFIRANHLQLEISFDWVPILRNEDEIYLFPNSLTSFMTRLYKSPAIYRWNVYKVTPTDERIIYIGEGQQLIPSRIKGYLNPGPSQMTNKRLNSRFHEYIQSGHKVLLETIRFDKISLEDLSFRQGDLANKHFRRFLEHMLIVYYQQQGYTMLNR